MWKRKGKSKPASPPPHPPPPSEIGLGSATAPASASPPEISGKPGSAFLLSEPEASAPPLAYGIGNGLSDPNPSNTTGIATGLNLALPPDQPPLISSFPTQDECLAHLRLLTAFDRLKTETGYRDGLWDIWDARAGTSTTSTKHPHTRNRDSNANNSEEYGHKTTKKAPIDPDTGSEPELDLDILIRLREKRWAIYLGRAVDRYAAWWRGFDPNMLLESDMLVVETKPGQPFSSSDSGGSRQDQSGTEGEDESGGSRQRRTRARYEGFPESKLMVWREEMLPPLDVLLVWHAHMLNPRLYLEVRIPHCLVLVTIIVNILTIIKDCLRYGYNSLWAAGIPWSNVNAAIVGPTFGYVVSHACKAHWETHTNLAWRNEDDPDAKDIPCPACSTVVSIPWTTCGMPRGYSGAK
ncbi:hypothetical protein COL5a_002524 [Colletotrichum fioriniae]|uniref:uncharacterized protein n=1 Tax=Colletotrichum fioriniae TaxID=710243 RepID=UPI0032D9AF24|nr:hypothetical protein COL5a_002524 [Colletotrichum fioriniae]KAJ3940994.1 hypothetical protein N0V96_008870 [Colletotrichum fioriniae]